MGSTLKHKILTLALIISASSALAGTNDLAASAGDCAQCALKASMNPPLAMDKMLQRLPIVQKDDRQIVKRTGENFEYNDVGVVVPEQDITDNSINEDGVTTGLARTGKFPSTAGLLNACMILTDYHSVFGDAKAPTDDPTSHRATFYVGADASGVGVNGSVSGKVTYVGQFQKNSRTDDFAVVTLDKCPGGDPTIGYHDSATGDPVSLKGLSVVEVGYPQDLSGNKPEKMMLSKQNCKVMGYSEGSSNMAISCRTTPGGSGSMVYGKIAGKNQLLGIVESGHPVYDKSGKQQGYVSDVITISQIVGAIHDQYSENLIVKNAGVNKKFGPKTRPQDKGPELLASAGR